MHDVWVAVEVSIHVQFSVMGGTTWFLYVATCYNELQNKTRIINGYLILYAK